jgi:hypothetical protein
MALLDFMKQGTQWLTDNTGMDWNKVQSDPGLAAKRLMGAPVDLNSQSQAQPTQANLLGATENIVVDPAMQNRQTFIPDDKQIKPNMGAVNQYNNFDYEENDTVDFYDPLQAKLTQQNGIRLSEGGYEESAKNAPVYAYDYANRENAPMYDSGVMGQAQDMSLLNATDDTQMSQVNVDQIDTTIPEENASKNTVYEQNNLAIADAIASQAQQPDYAITNPVDKVSSDTSNNIANLNEQQAYTVEMIMGNPRTSNAEKAALLKQYNIDPLKYSIPGLITGK